MRLVLLAILALPLATGQQPAGNENPGSEERAYTITSGTRIPLGLINSISTKQAVEGDRVYLETVFPILADGRIVIPPGSYVAGTVTQAKRAGRIKGRAELFIRFDSLTLPNGVTRDFRARVGGLDGRASEHLDRAEGKITGEGDKGGDARTVGETGAGGAALGAIIGSSSGHAAMGAGIGAAAGATAGLVGVLMSRGPDAALPRGTTVEMVLDRSLSFTETELSFSGAPPRRSNVGEGSGPLPSKSRDSRLPKRYPLPGRTQ